MTQRNEDRIAKNEKGETPKSRTKENARYGRPEVLELGRIDAVMATSYGSIYDGLYTTRSWYHT